MSYQNIAEMRAELTAKRVSALELAEQAIARIEQLDGKINAIIARDFDRAREAARAADASRALGDDRPLLGIPVTVKESFNLAGLPTTWGVPGSEGNIARSDSVVVARLKAAGAVVLGKSNVPTMLMDWQSTNPIHGTTNNPWNLDLTPGGSSGGGSAALAAGYVPLEFGSDIGGSLRVPAHFCGVFAHKPTHGIVPMRGMSPPGTKEAEIAAEVDLAVAGPMARSAADLALALDLTAGPDQHQAIAYRLDLPPPRHVRLRDFRVLLLDTHPLVPTSAEIRAAFEALAADLVKAGCKVARASSVSPDLARLAQLYGRMLMAFIGADLPEAQYDAVRQQVAGLPPEAQGFDVDGTRALVASHRDWKQAYWQRAGFANQWRALFRDVDVVLCPVLPVTAFAHDHRDFAAREIMIDGVATPYGRLGAWAGPATFTGQPATAMPVGLSPSGLPIGMQILGPLLEDRTTLKFAELVEQARGGFVKPPLSWA
jgi:amidase